MPLALYIKYFYFYTLPLSLYIRREVVEAGEVDTINILQAALKAMGPCAIHRRSWSPIKALLEA